MNPTEAAPTPADDQPVTDVARRVGPPIVVASLVLTAALLAWLALAPTAIAGDLADAPFAVPATLVVPPDDQGCLQVVQGDGTAREHCLEQFARTDDDFRHIEAYVDEDGRLLVGERPQLQHVDPATGAVLGTVDVSDDDLLPDEPPPPSPEDEQVAVPGEPDARGLEVYARDDRVVRPDPSDGRGTGTEQVLLDLQGPPGYHLHDAVLSPDEQWVVALTPDGQVVVAPVDGSADPHVWTELSGHRWLDLWRAISWNG